MTGNARRSDGDRHAPAPALALHSPLRLFVMFRGNRLPMTVLRVRIVCCVIGLRFGLGFSFCADANGVGCVMVVGFESGDTSEE